MEGHIKTKMHVFLGILAMTFSFMGGYSIFYGSVYSIRWYLFYYGKFFLIALFIMFSYSYYNKDIALRKTRRWMLWMFLAPMVVMFVYSVVLWVMQRTAFPYITRGCSDTLFQIWAYVGGICFAFVYKKDAPRYGLCAALITYSCGLILGLLSVVRVQLSLVLNLNSSAQTFQMNAFLELHEIVYVIGLYIIFLLFINKKEYIKECRLLLIISIVYFILGGKRIGLAAVLGSSLYGLLMKGRTKRAKSKLIAITGWLGIAVCIVYVALSVSDKLSGILSACGIEMMGRDIIYSYFRKFCSFRPTYLGRGVGFVSRQFDYTTEADLRNMVSIKALHNDFMKIFINIGFMGFLIWCWYWLRQIPRRIEKKIDSGTALSVLLLILYAFITYTTDNTEGYSNFQMHLSMLISVICYIGYAKKTGNQAENREKSGRIEGSI